jgi:hypothetical protein
MLDLTIASKERHDRFVHRATESGEVWGLKSADGWACSASTAESTKGKNVMPFWSDRAYARQCSKGDWSHYEPTSIPLALFLERWLTGMAADGCLVGTNWNAQLCGYEIEPLELKQEIEKQLERRS